MNSELVHGCGLYNGMFPVAQPRRTLTTSDELLAKTLALMTIVLRNRFLLGIHLIVGVIRGALKVVDEHQQGLESRQVSKNMILVLISIDFKHFEFLNFLLIFVEDL